MTDCVGWTYSSAALCAIVSGVVREYEMSGREGKEIEWRNVESATGRSSASVCVTIKSKTKFSSQFDGIFDKKSRKALFCSNIKSERLNRIFL